MRQTVMKCLAYMAPIFVTITFVISSNLASAQPTPTSQPVLTWGDQGNGTYKNPVLKSDYSDPDILRVGGDFYLIASDFAYVGIQVLHSKDLVNWHIIGQVFDRLGMDPKYDQMNGYGQGTWAPSLRYHNGEFYLYVCTPYDGLFMWHAKNPVGPWTGVTVKAVPQWEDPCPIWDDDGQAYLVHSHKGAGPLILHKMSEDGTKLLDDGKEIYQGPTSEGPKFYKRNSYYYISLPEGGVSGGYQTMLRSRDIYGPYERKIVLPAGSPHQGGIVDLDNGESWFIAFKQTGFLGRIAYLEPVKWGEDGWPVFGDNGKPVDVWKKPNVGVTEAPARPETSDEFDGTALNPIWQWNHNPVPESWSLTDHPGFLRLKAVPATEMRFARNTLTQKLWDDAGVIDTKIDASHLADGQRAGLTFMSGSTFGWVGVGQENGRRQIFWGNDQPAPPARGTTASSQQSQTTTAPGKFSETAGPAISGDTVWLRGICNGDRGALWYSLDGKTYVDTKYVFRLQFLNWKGARFGIFSFGNSGAADFDSVHYRYGATVDSIK